jgi:hypothetical protein
MSKSTWTGAVSSDWNDADNWSPVGVPGASSDVVIATGRAVASASIGTVNSITDSSDLRFRSAGTNTVTTFLDNRRDLRVDRKGGAGGTILNIGGRLSNSGSLYIGNATLSAPDKLTAAALDNTGVIRLLGSSANQALLDITGSAGFGTAGVLSGYVQLTRDSAIEFKSGEITSLAANAQLHLNGNDAFIEDSTAPGSNSALTGLASIGAGATFNLYNGASVSTTGALANDGTIDLDTNGGTGGSSLTLEGALTNSGALNVGNGSLSSSTKLSTTALTNSGTIFFAGGSKTNIAAGLSNEGHLNINQGSSVSIGGSLVNDGGINLTTGQGDGGAGLAVAGTLFNNTSRTARIPARTARCTDFPTSSACSRSPTALRCRRPAR